MVSNRTLENDLLGIRGNIFHRNAPKGFKDEVPDRKNLGVPPLRYHHTFPLTAQNLVDTNKSLQWLKRRYGKDGRRLLAVLNDVFSYACQAGHEEDPNASIDLRILVYPSSVWAVFRDSDSMVVPTMDEVAAYDPKGQSVTENTNVGWIHNAAKIADFFAVSPSGTGVYVAVNRSIETP